MNIAFTVAWLLVILISVHSVECYSDTCDTYHLNQFLCGDVCLDHLDLCECGSQNLTGGYSNYKYCCALASACTRTKTGAKCSSGEVLSYNSHTTLPCNATGRCFNDVLTSQHLYYWAKYTCQDKCTDWRDMCRGVSFCARDHEACGPELRCPHGAIKLNMPTIPLRYYCYRDYKVKEIRNNGSYDLLDRSDEDLPVSSVSTIKISKYQNINYTALATCDIGIPGVMCDEVCWDTTEWCTEQPWSTMYCENSGVSTRDPGLCSHPTFWQEIGGCNWYHKGLLVPGFRCTGAIKHCYYPFLLSASEIFPAHFFPTTKP